MPDVASLLSEIKRKAQIHADQQVITDAEILRMASNELRSVIVPKILSLNEGFFNVIYKIALSATRVYRIPSWAVGARLNDVIVVDTGGGESSLNQVHEADMDSRVGYFVRGSHLVLTAQAPTSGTLKLIVPARPGDLTTDSATYKVGTVSSVNSATSLTASASYTGSVDIVKATSPYEYAQVGCSQSTTTITVSDSTHVAVGDFIMKTGYLLYPQIPDEWHDILSQRAAMRVLEQLRNNVAAQLLGEKLIDLERVALDLLSPRTINEEKVAWTGELLGHRSW